MQIKAKVINEMVPMLRKICYVLKKNKQTDRQAGRRAGGRAGRQAERQTDRQADRRTQIDRQTKKVQFLWKLWIFLFLPERHQYCYNSVIAIFIPGFGNI